MAFEGFAGFTEFDVDTSDGRVHGRRGGSGPPLLLLHGIPETHLMWHRLAPELAERFTVVATDLRGYGGSGCPPSTADHAPYSMRSVAAEQVAAMRTLGHDRFAVAGHDRGARCAYRMALDHSDVVTRLAVLDIVPTAEAYARADARFALGYWVWTFLAAAAPVPETFIAAHPELLVDHALDVWPDDPTVFGPEERAAYAEQFRDPERVHAICEQYRAAATLDVAHDEADRAAGRRITCPTLALWSGGGPVAQWYDPAAIWRDWAEDVRARAMPGGHFIPEEVPDETLAELLPFLLG